MAELRYESLHNHTIISDGKLTHLELLAAAERQGIGVLGFTDHDCVPTPEIMKQLRAYQGPVKWTVGIELSVGLPKELPDWDKHSLHLLGLFVNPNDAAIAEFGETIIQGRFERMQRVVKHLQSLGFDITEADCLAAAGQSQLGNPHMVSAALAKPINVALMAQFKDEMKLAAEHDATIRVNYDKMITSGSRQEPYALFMGSRSFKPLPKSPMLDSRDLDAGVKMIRDAGGTAIFAHPYYYEDYFSYDDLDKWLADKRLDGIEAEVENRFDEGDSSELFAKLRQMVTRNQVIGISSCDAHDEADLEAFAKSDVGERSVGQTAAMLERLKPNLEFSKL